MLKEDPDGGDEKEQLPGEGGGFDCGQTECVFSALSVPMIYSNISIKNFLSVLCSSKKYISITNDIPILNRADKVFFAPVI